jgi:hypothetical protein
MATATLRVYTGTNAGTESSAQTAIALMDIDSAVVTPANSFEKWLRVKIDTAGSHTFSNFWIERSGDLPDGVVVKMGVTDNPGTPVAVTSAVATTTMADGRRYLFDANEYDADNEASRYVVLQGQVASDAASGAIEQQVFTVGWQQS